METGRKEDASGDKRRKKEVMAFSAEALAFLRQSLTYELLRLVAISI